MSMVPYLGDAAEMPPWQQKKPGPKRETPARALNYMRQNIINGISGLLLHGFGAVGVGI